MKINSRCRASLSRPADATAYASGDLIGNSLTAGLVVPLEFPISRDALYGRVLGCRAVATPASGNLVITACDFDLLLFHPLTAIPFADAGFPADNAALNISAAAGRELIGIFSFLNTGWRNSAGGLTAGITGFQQIASTRSLGFQFDLTGYAKSSLIGVIQCKGAWTPGAVVNQLDFDLEIETI